MEHSHGFGVLRVAAVSVVSALALAGCGSATTDLPSQPILPSPTGVTIQSSSSGVQVSWDPVSGAVAYRVYWSLGSTVTRERGTMARSSGTTFLQSGLQDGQTYAFIVSAVDERGQEGRASPVVTTTLGAIDHEAPQDVRAIAGDAQVTIEWSPVPNASGYRVVVSSAQGTTTLAPDPAGPPVVHGRLINRSMYTYTVRAKFGERLGPPSLPVSATPMPTQPGVPVITDVQSFSVRGFSAGGGVASHGMISLSWTPMEHATNYRVFARKEGESEIALIPSDHPLKTPSFNHEPVDYETVYEYRIEALNDGVASGQFDPTPPPVRASVPLPLQDDTPYYYTVMTSESATSNQASATPLQNVMLTPPTLVRVADTPRDSGSSLTVTWVPSTTRGVTGQRLERSTTGAPGSYVAIQGFDGKFTSIFTDTTVVDGVRYFYALRALAGELESELSLPASGIAVSNEALSAPTDLSVEDTLDDVGTSLNINWRPSTARDVTGQRLYRSADDGGPYNLIAEMSDPLLEEYLDQTALTGVTYYYVVRAFRGGQESPPSNQATGTAEANSEPFPPRSLVASDFPADLGGAIDLLWTPSVSTAVTEQRLYRSTSSGGPYQLAATFADTTVSRYTDVGVPNAPTPTGLAVVSDALGLRITWSPLAVAVDGYRVYWWEENDLGETVSSGTFRHIISQQFVHLQAELTSGSRYLYAIQAEGYPGVSPPVAVRAP